MLVIISLLSIMRKLFLVLALFTVNASVSATIWQPLQPSPENPFYWEYKGETVIFFGASDDDNIFQFEETELINQLDRLVAAGGNQLRNVMSSRDEGNLQPFKQLASGLYDLNQWNSIYWDKLDKLLRMAQQRRILVQIEIWDRFDYHDTFWLKSAFNPNNNINYTVSNSSLEAQYPVPGYTELNPFLKTVPGLENNAVVLTYQRAFVKKVVSTAAPYGNVLFCVSNETRLPKDWSYYWADFIADEAEKLGRDFPITEMLDSHDVTQAIHMRTVEDSSGRFSYVDISQNSWKRGDENWANAQSIRSRLSDTPKPINSTKIYGKQFGVGINSITDDDAVHNFWRNLLGGFATSRFHRPPSHGMGLSEKSIVQLKAARAWVNQFDLLNARPDSNHDLMEDRDADEAYLSYVPSKEWTLFFPDGGSVTLLTNIPGAKRIRWVNLETGEWTPSSQIAEKNETDVTITTPGSGPWLAVVEMTADLTFDYEAWRKAYFDSTQQSNPGISGPNAAPNQDGVLNKLKHILGYKPFDRIQIFRSASDFNPGVRGFEFQRNIEMDTFPIIIETTTSLDNWQGTKSEYFLQVVNILEPTEDLPAREVLRISPPSGSSPSQWFVRLRIDE